MKSLLKILSVILSTIGIVAIVLFVRTTLNERKLDRSYECNCQDVKQGMFVADAMKIMARGLDTNYRGFDFGVDFNESVPADCYLSYSTNGGSYIATIHYDKNTGQITKVNCPPKRCE